MLDQRLSDLNTLIPTEQQNSLTQQIDEWDTNRILTTINQQDQHVAVAVQAAIPQITRIVDRIVLAFEAGHRLFYMGAGTSGRLGVLDASECPPTFSVDPRLVQGIVAGGDIALRHAVEGAEDCGADGQAAVDSYSIEAGDILIGLSASGGAPYVVEALQYAKEKGVFTGAITCVKASTLAQTADIAIVVEVGPEILAGSTRLKAGTAQKLVLNMISTTAMIQWGKTYGNLMVDVKPTNHKLRQRAVRLITQIGLVPAETAGLLLEETQGQVKPAILMARTGLSYDEVQQMLKQHRGKLRLALADYLKGDE